MAAKYENYTMIIVHNTFPNIRNPCSFESNLLVTRKCPEPGLTAEIVGYLLTYAKIQYKLQRIPQSIIDKMGFVKAVYHLLNTNQSNSGSMLFYPTEYRLQNFAVSSTFPTSNKISGLVAKKAPNEVADEWVAAFNFSTVFDMYTWLALLMLWLLIKIYRKILTSDQFIKTFRNIGQKRLLEMHVNKVLGLSLAWMGFFLLMFTALYRSGLLSRIILKTENTQYRDLNELIKLANRGAIKIVTPRSAGWMKRVEEYAKHPGIFREFEEAIRKHPPIYLGSGEHELQDAADMLTDSDRTIIYPSTVLGAISSNSCENLKLVIFHEFRSEQNVLLFSPDTPKWVTETLNETIVKNNGAILHIESKYLASSRRKGSCMKEQKIREQSNEGNETNRKSKRERNTPMFGRHKPLSFQDIVGVLGLLIVGLIVAMMSLFTEYFVRQIMDIRSNVQRFVNLKV